MTSSRLAATFAAAKAERRAAFIAFLCAGDPSLEATRGDVLALGRAGCDIVELGVPFSDPIADGPVIQRASERALAAGVTLSAVLELVRDLRRDPECPALVLFSYFNPIHRLGARRFAATCESAGVDGVLITDLPFDEPEPIHLTLEEKGMPMIPLLAPTSSRQRIAAARSGGGFVYAIARTGVTGRTSALGGDVARFLARIRRASTLPIALGFGIGDSAGVRRAAKLADGVVVGSALVAALEASPIGDRAERAVAFVQPLLAACRRTEAA